MAWFNTRASEQSRLPPTGQTLRATTSPGSKDTRQASTHPGAPVSSIMPLRIMSLTGCSWQGSDMVEPG